MAAVTLTTYIDTLPLDIMGLIVPYLMYGSAGNYDYGGVVATSIAFLFRRLLRRPYWGQLTAAYPRVMYRTYWSSNNYVAARHVRHDGTIDYARLWECIKEQFDNRNHFTLANDNCVTV